MKSIYTLFVCTLLFSSTLFAYARGLQEKMDGQGDIAQETTVSLGKGVVDFSGTLREEIILKTPYTSMPGSNLILDTRRSITLLDSYDIESLEPALRDKVQQVVNNKDRDLDINFDKRGLNNFYVMANFVHHMSPEDKQDFFIAIIPKNIEVERVIFQVEWFDNGAGGHNQVRMIMNQPIVVIPQKADVYSAMVLQNQNGKADMVYSLQAARVKGGNAEWNPLEGIMGEYANALQFFSIQAKAKKQIYSAVIDQYELVNLTVSQKRAIFDAARINSDSMEETKIYNTILNSCVSHAILVLRGNKNESGDYLGIKNVDTLIFNPYTVIAQLRETIIDDKTGTKLELRQIARTMNEEFSEYEAYGKIFTEDERRKTKAYQTLAPFEKVLQEKPELAAKIEDIVRKIAIYVVDNDITLDGVQNFLERAKKVAAGELSIEKAFSSADSQEFYGKIDSAWSSTISKSDSVSLVGMLDFLTTVQTQDLKKVGQESQ